MKNKIIYFIFLHAVKNTNDSNNPGLNGLCDINLGIKLSTAIVTTRKTGRPLRSTDLARNEKRETSYEGLQQREDCHHRPCRLSSETM